MTDEIERLERIPATRARADVAAAASPGMLDAIRELHDWIDDIEEPSDDELARMITGAVDLALLNETRWRRWSRN